MQISSSGNYLSPIERPVRHGNGTISLPPTPSFKTGILVPAVFLPVHLHELSFQSGANVVDKDR